jgi:hypothetical protein
MKKVTLVLVLLIGFSFASQAYEIPGKRVGEGTVGGVRVIKCRGTDGICVSIIPSEQVDPGYTAFVHNPDGDIAEEFPIADFAVSEDDDGNADVALQLLP